MISNILSVITNFIILVISAFGYAGIALLMAVQTIAIPIPSEIILPFAGFLAFGGKFNIWLIALTGSVGSCAGSLIAYWIGAKGGRPLVEKYGRMILISRHDLEITDKFFSRHGSKAVFIGMMLPVFRSFISFPAGISRVPVKKFLAYVFLGSFFWGLFLSFLGMKLGENWNTLRDKFKGFDIAIVVLIGLAVLFWIYRHFKNRKRELGIKNYGRVDRKGRE